MCKTFVFDVLRRLCIGDGVSKLFQSSDVTFGDCLLSCKDS